MHIHRVFCLALSLISPVFSQEDYYQAHACCTFRGPNFVDTEYIVRLIFNHHDMVKYNSTRGNWIAFTPYSRVILGLFNNPSNIAMRIVEKNLLCENNLQFIRDIGKMSTPPTVNIKLVKQPSKGHPAMLVCSAYNFYPKQIRMRWLRNEQEVTAGVSYSSVMTDGEFYYQMHSYLQYTVTSGEKITCMIEHLSLPQPKTVVWDNSLPAKAEITVGLCGLIIGLVILISGLIYYKKKSAASITFYQGRRLVPVATTEQL